MNFGKTFLAALLALIVGFGVMVFLWTMLMVGMMAALGSSEAVVVSDGSVLKFDLASVTDSPQGGGFLGSRSFNPFSFSTVEIEQSSLLKTLQAIEAAATDDKIKGIYINKGFMAGISMGHIEEIRAALERFKESGKFVVAYEEMYDQGSYYLASVADKVYMNPVGDLSWTGLLAEIEFYKGLYDKFGVEPVVVRHGSFKSAVEPMLLKEMSPENRMQYEKIFGSIWNVMLESISASRGIEVPALQLLADELAIDSPEAAVEMKMIDGLKYQNEVYDEIRTLTGETDMDKEPKFISIADYASQLSPKKVTSKNKIAVIYADGAIAVAKGFGGEIDSESMREKLKKALKDEHIKAVVLRINSPGGSGLASDVIWKDIEILKAEKPVIVSMGNYAASGGYYIAAPADAIYADKTTLTGSIGVFARWWNLENALESNLGITFDRVKTAKHAEIGSPMFHSPSEAEMAFQQKGVESFYSTFISRVAAGRNMTIEAVDAIGQGRVWSGADAKEIGLIDGFGGLVDAISLAAERVGVADDFRITEIVDTPTGLEAFFAGLSAQLRASVLKNELGPLYDQYMEIRSANEQQGIQARMPYHIEIH